MSLGAAGSKATQQANWLEQTIEDSKAEPDSDDAEPIPSASSHSLPLHELRPDETLSDLWIYCSNVITRRKQLRLSYSKV